MGIIKLVHEQIILLALEILGRKNIHEHDFDDCPADAGETVF